MQREDRKRNPRERKDGRGAEVRLAYHKPREREKERSPERHTGCARLDWGGRATVNFLIVQLVSLYRYDVTSGVCSDT